MVADWISVLPASYGYASVVTSRPCARASPIISSITGVSARPALLMWTTCNGAWASAASASASLSPATPGRMCTCIGVFVLAATRNTASSSSRVAAAYGVRRDDGDPSARDSDVADGIEVGGWIHYVSAEDHAVVDRRRAELQDE